MTYECATVEVPYSIWRPSLEACSNLWLFRSTRDRVLERIYLHNGYFSTQHISLEHMVEDM